MTHSWDPPTKDAPPESKREEMSGKPKVRASHRITGGIFQSGKVMTGREIQTGGDTRPNRQMQYETLNCILLFYTTLFGSMKKLEWGLRISWW